ncbi:MAG TPA: hypothetical protein VEB66_15310 [Opitutaceae bacterium]|nr:hypothetical protein [Opitutaceae bacterium]
MPTLLRLLAGLVLAQGLLAADAPPRAGRGAIGEIQPARPGPWGAVEYTRIVIEPPSEFMAPDYRFRAFAVWNFGGHGPAELDALWASAGLPPELRSALRDPAIATVTAAGTTLRPPASLVRALPPESRARIYGVLANLPGNPLHEMPFLFRSDMVDEWLDDPTLPPRVYEEVRRLLYRRGNSMLFSDPDLVLPLVASAAERVQLIKTLSRKSALLVRVRVRPDSDIDALAAYWGRGHRQKDVRPLLQSLARHPQGITLDAAHLLPRFPRGLLYTFPPGSEPMNPRLNCHWSSMNFFRDEPDPRLADPQLMREVLDRDYRRLEPGAPRLFGDVLLLVRADGTAVHSCVYVADEIVFTKNGYSYQMPWVLATIGDVLAAYPQEPALEQVVYRSVE